MRLSGHFLPLSTIAWGIAIYFVFGNLDALNRYSGLSGIPPISIGPVSLGGTTAIYFFIWILLGAVMLLCRNLLDSRQGRAIRSLRGGVAMVESLAIDSLPHAAGDLRSRRRCSPGFPAGSMRTCSAS